MQVSKTVDRQSRVDRRISKKVNNDGSSQKVASLISGKSFLINSKRSSSKKRAQLKQIVYFGDDTKQSLNSKNTNREPGSMIGTFSLVLFLTMLKEAYEDYQRYKAQKEVNKKKAKVYNHETKKFEFKKWEDIKAGQVIRLEKDGEVPADTLVIYTSNISGLVFVDTMALDGETNLKEKIAILENFDEKETQNLSGEIFCDTPNEFLEYWEASVTSNAFKDKVQCSIKNLLLRGAFIRNTKFAIGIVVYTGQHTKIFKNLKKPPHKVSNVMKKMNLMLYTVFIFQILIIIVFAALNNKWATDNYATHYEAGKTAGDATFVQTFLLQLLTYWVAYSHMIPISLYVFLEVLKLGQGTLINKDIQLFDQETKQFANCRNSDLIEELGQVEMIFSDKTGTLTMNKMIFKKCTIMGMKYGEPLPSEILESMSDGMVKSGVDELKQQLKSESKKFYKALRDANKHDTPYDYPHLNFLKVLTLCHSVVCDTSGITNVIRYQASSPDELALVNGAKDVGIELVARNHARLEIENKLIDVKENYKVVAEFPFDSTRKCMSVIIRDQYLKYFLYTKGADSVMLEKINFEKSDVKGLKEIVQKELYNYSCEGLRTLVMAMRQVPEDEYQQFQKIYNKLMNSNHPYKDKKITELYKRMEAKLRYVGATAIEDKLQEGVPATIAMLIKADIRFWMLTGDKLETAIEIAKSCKVIQDDMGVVVLSTQDFELLNKTLDVHIEQYDLRIEKKVKSLKNYEQQNIVIAIDGQTLNLVLEDPELEQKFFYVSLVAKSVVCCRVSPKQKADIVALYKKRGSWVTLSVGDGANDVSMILEANIGVGIRGKEGTQAVRAADYSISQFRYIQKLLLVHGRWGYRRVSKMICYYFYKNIILVFTELHFAFQNGFSGQIYFLDWLPMLYNAVFTSWQCLFAYMYEQDVNIHYTYKYPIVYKAGQQGNYFTFGIFWRQIIFALWHGVVCFYLPMICKDNSLDATGQPPEHWYLSTISFTMIIHTVCYKLFVESSFWNIFSWYIQKHFINYYRISGIGSVLIFYIVTLIGSSQAVADIFQPQLNGVMPSIVTNSRFYLIIIVGPFLCLLPDITWKYGRAIFYPFPGEKIMIAQKKNPSYSFFEQQITVDLGKFISGVIKKNKSYGQLTSKALSEMDKNSNASLGKRSMDGMTVFSRGLRGLSPTGSQSNSRLNPSPAPTKNETSEQNQMIDVKMKNNSKFKKDRLNETNQVLLNNESSAGYSENEYNNSLQSSQLKNQLNNTNRKLEQELGINKQGVIGKRRTIKEESNEESFKIPEMGQMKESSYQERKRKLKENIRQQLKQKELDEQQQMRASFHSTQSNNKQISKKLDEMNAQLIKTMKSGDKTKIKDMKKHREQNQMNLGLIFKSQNSNAQTNSDKQYFSDIPTLVRDNQKNQKVDAERLKQEGHPLEKITQNGIKGKKDKKKKYVEKYRELLRLNDETTDNNGGNLSSRGGFKF